MAKPCPRCGFMRLGAHWCLVCGNVYNIDGGVGSTGKPADSKPAFGSSNLPAPAKTPDSVGRLVRLGKTVVLWTETPPSRG